MTEFAGPEAANMVPVNRGATGAGIQLGRSVGGHVVNGDLVRGPVLALRAAAVDTMVASFTNHLVNRIFISRRSSSSNHLVRALLLLTAILIFSITSDSTGPLNDRASADTRITLPMRQPAPAAQNGEGLHFRSGALKSPPELSDAARSGNTTPDHQRARKDIFFKADSIEIAAPTRRITLRASQND